MTIEKGKAWGEHGPLGEAGVFVATNTEARAAVSAAMEAGRLPPPLGLLGGDLARTMGATGDRGRIESSDAMRFPIDLGVATLDGDHYWFVAHAVARRSWWRGRVVAAMNAEWIGLWDVAPRAHPNDGRLDILDANPGIDDRFKMRSRLPSGQHLPHPKIAVLRVAQRTMTFERPLDLWLDGQLVGRGRELHLAVLPDALVCVV